MASLLFKATMSDMYINIISGRGWSFRSMFDRPALPHGTLFHCPRSWRPEVDFFFLEKEKFKDTYSELLKQPLAELEKEERWFRDKGVT